MMCKTNSVVPMETQAKNPQCLIDLKKEPHDSLFAFELPLRFKRFFKVASLKLTIRPVVWA